MRFWDSSAIIPLIVLEEESAYCTRAVKTDGDIIVWTLSKVEVFSALCRRFREQILKEKAFESAKKRMNDLFDGAFEIVSIPRIKQRAIRLLQVHPLRAADALQLASVLVASEEDPSRLSVVCFDKRLSQAAKKEGFEVNPD